MSSTRHVHLSSNSLPTSAASPSRRLHLMPPALLHRTSSAALRHAARPCAQQGGNPRCRGAAGRLTVRAAATVDKRTPTSNAALSKPEPGDGAHVPPFDYFDQWYPVAFVGDIDKKAPVRFVLLGIPLAIWWDPQSAAWRAFQDVCPHRLVPLSEGRINKAGLLECGYHGWAFSGSGKCEVIPQEGKLDTPRSCALAYPCAVRQGLLFVKPAPLPKALLPGGRPNPGLASALAQVAADEARIPIVPELEDPTWMPGDTWRDLPYDWLTLLENVLDSSHVPFTHHASMSNRNVLGPYDITMTSPVTRDGFSGNWATGPRAGKLGPQSTVFSAPCFMKHRLEGKGLQSLVVVYAVPSAPGRCRLINRNVLRFAGGPPALLAPLFRRLPRWLNHVGAHVLLEDDQIFLHLGEEEVAARRLEGQSLAQAAYMPSKADTYIIAFQNWIQKFGGGGPFGPVTADYLAALGPRQGREELLDRWSQHTQHCASCLQGLRDVHAAKAAAAALAVGAAGLALLCAAVGITAAAVAGGAAAGSGLAAAAGGGDGGALAALGGAMVAVGQAVVGQVDGTGVAQALRAAAWLAAAALAGVAWARLSRVEESFFKGVYPPPRNVKD